jgi:3',5'-cyclic AMP phosphodiesterase CpdA
MDKVLEIRPLKRKDTDAINILHLSDLHFTHRTKLFDEEVGGLDKQRRERFLNFLEDRIAASKKAGQFEKYDLIFVTGDLADNSAAITDEHSHEKVLEAARSYLDGLCREEGIDPAVGLLVIPGNHDYRWKGNLFSEDARDCFRRIFNRQFQNCIFDFGDFRLLAACFDSNHVRFKGDRASFASGIVDLSSVMDLAKELAELPDEEQPSLRTALVHHHPLPVAKGEVLDPRNWIERMFSKALEGAPEFMLLRNSGGFLHKLLEHNFCLVLHGHLHQRGYWRALTDNDGRWLEVISGGAAGTAEQNQSFSFNRVKIYRDGYFEAAHHGFDHEGHAEPLLAVPTAPYEVCRERHWDRAPGCQFTVRSETYSQTWDVVYPQGDLVSSEVYLGLHSADGSAQSKLTVAISGEGLTQSLFLAEALSDNSEITHKTEVPPGIIPTTQKTTQRIEYALSISPPLTGDKRVNIITLRHTKGILFRSKEDQERFGVKEDEGWDYISQKIVHPCERMLIRVRFHQVPADSRFPEKLVLQVLDSADFPAPREEVCGHLSWDYWSPQRLQRVKSHSAPEAVLSVFHPRLGYTYVLRWRLNEFDDLPPKVARTEISQLREALRRRPTNNENLATANDFARAALETFWRLDAPRGVHREDANLRAYLYAFDEVENVLVCRGSTGAPEDPMAAARFRYGRDMIGTAFRRGEAVGFARPRYERGFELYESLPPSVEFLFAAPLNWPSENDTALGVIALATTSKTSDLGNVVMVPERGRSLEQALFALWDAKRALLGC